MVKNFLRKFSLEFLTHSIHNQTAERLAVECVFHKLSTISKGPKPVFQSIFQGPTTIFPGQQTIFYGPTNEFS